MPDSQAHPPLTPIKPPSHRILPKLGYLLSARWLREALQAAFFIYLARVSATTYGEFMLALGLGSILLFLAEFGLNLPLVSRLAARDQDPGEALTQVSLLRALLLILGLIGVLVFLDGQDYSPGLKKLMLVLSLGVGLEALASTFFVAFQVKGRQDLEGKIRAAAAGLGFGYGLVTLALGAAPLTVALFKLIETLGSLAGGVAAVAGLGFAPWRRPSFRRLPATLRQGLVFALLEVTAITYNKANLFFLQQAGGPVAVGQYSVTWQVVDGFSTLVTGLLLQSVMFPLFVQLWEADRTEVSRLAQEAARWLLAAAVPLMFVLFIESDRLIFLIFGPQYREAVWLQKYLVATIAIAFLHNLAAFLLLSMNLARLLLFFYLGGLIFNLAWCALVIPWTPLLGAALAMVLTKGGVAVATVSACQRRLNLLPGRALGQLGAAALGGLLLYLLATSHLPRLAGEALALTPLIALAWHWWRGGKKTLGGGPWT